MTQYKVTDTELSSIANAIRTKGGTSAPLVFPSGFVSAVINIPTGGGANLGSISISQNGTYTPTGGLDGFDNVVVNVESGITPSGSISISQNGTYDVSSFANAVVSVPQEGGSDDKYKITMGLMSGIINDADTVSIQQSTFIIRHSILGVNMPNVEYVGQNAFWGCDNMSFASLEKCEFLSTGAFVNCSNLTEAFIPKCSRISTDSFQSCIKLQTINASACERISGRAFQSCKQLSSLTLPICSELAGSSIFQGCKALSALYLLSDSVVPISATNVFYQTPMSLSTYLGQFGSVYVPASLVNDYKTASNWNAYSDRITSYIE